MTSYGRFLVASVLIGLLCVTAAHSTPGDPCTKCNCREVPAVWVIGSVKQLQWRTKNQDGSYKDWPMAYSPVYTHSQQLCQAGAIDTDFDQVKIWVSDDHKFICSDTGSLSPKECYTQPIGETNDWEDYWYCWEQPGG